MCSCSTYSNTTDKWQTVFSSFKFKPFFISGSKKQYLVNSYETVSKIVTAVIITMSGTGVVVLENSSSKEG